MKRTITALTAVASLTLAGCGQTSAELDVPAADSTEVTSEPEPATPEPTEEETTEEETTEDEPLGEDVEWAMVEAAIESSWGESTDDEQAGMCDSYMDGYLEDLADSATGYVSLSKDEITEFYVEFFDEKCAALDAAQDKDGGGSASSDGTAAFGESFTYDDGLTVTISEPQDFTPSDTAAGNEHHSEFVMFTITVENGSDEPLDLVMAMTNVQSGTGEGSRVFDSGNGIEGEPSTTLLPARSAEWAAVFGVDDPSDLVVEFTPTWDHEPVFYVSD